MTIRTRTQIFKSLDLPTSWANKVKDFNPNDILYITTEKPIDLLSAEELIEIVEDRRVQAIIEDAEKKLFEAIDVLKGYGAEIDIEIKKGG
jgi:hypothetical protein